MKKTTAVIILLLSTHTAILTAMIILGASCAHTPRPPAQLRHPSEIIDDAAVTLTYMQKLREEMNVAITNNNRREALIIALKTSAETTRLLTLCSELTESIRFRFYSP